MVKANKETQVQETSTEEKARPGQKKLSEAECESIFNTTMEVLGRNDLSLAIDERGKCSVLQTKGRKSVMVIDSLSGNTFAKYCEGAKLFAGLSQEVSVS